MGGLLCIFRCLLLAFVPCAPRIFQAAHSRRPAESSAKEELRSFAYRSCVLFLCSISLVFGFPLEAPFSFEVKNESIRVVDGDTFLVSLSSPALIQILEHPEVKDYLTIPQLQKVLEKKKISIRFAEIDAPERAQNFGEVSRFFLSHTLAQGGPVRFHVEAIDKYQRLVAKVYQKEKWLNQVMVRSGFAWVYPEYRSDFRLDEDEAYAKKNKYGLWQDPNPIRPSEWRRHHKPKKEWPSVVGKVKNITASSLIQIEQLDGSIVRAQLSDVRLPKGREPYAHEAQETLRATVPMGRTVRVEVLQKSINDASKVFGIVYVEDESVSVNQKLVQAGSAFVYPRYAMDHKLYALQKKARSEKQGLWQAEYSELPWRAAVKHERAAKDALLLKQKEEG